MTPPNLVTVTVDPAFFAEVARTLRNDYRAKYRVGQTICLLEAGGLGELHVHLHEVLKAPAAGGTAQCGLTVLPVDVRWNLLWALAQAELPLFRHKIWELMKSVEQQVGEAFLAEQQDT
jgi:hypothetical protein